MPDRPPPGARDAARGFRSATDSGPVADATPALPERGWQEPIQAAAESGPTRAGLQQGEPPASPERARHYGHSFAALGVGEPSVADPTTAATGPIQRRANRTGMPDRLKEGLEGLSGLDLSEVRVHRNSDKPARLNASAMTEGSEIHLGPAQERHLPHEAWHVVQQGRGQVEPTGRRHGRPVNEEQSLEAEATEMGARAVRATPSTGRRLATPNLATEPPLQFNYERLTILPGAFFTPGVFADAPRPGVIIETVISLRSRGSTTDAAGLRDAMKKISQLALQDESPLHVAISIGLNGKIDPDDTRLVEDLNRDSAAIVAYADSVGVACNVIPMTWTMPKTSKGGYVFPFIEARSAVGQNGGTLELQRLVQAAAAGEPVYHRTMDVDVSEDPLLGPEMAPDEDAPQREARLGARNLGQRMVADALRGEPGKIITGGYNWKTSDLDPATQGTLQGLITIINEAEHALREAISAIPDLQGGLYAPEPNTYIPDYFKELWDKGLQSGLSSEKDYETQMGESTFGMNAMLSMGAPLAHVKEISTTKPRKNWLDNFDPMVAALDSKDLATCGPALVKLVGEIHQSYLNPEVAISIAAKHGQQYPEHDSIKGLVKKHRKMLAKKLTTEFEVA